jgi:hypothetical protein
MQPGDKVICIDQGPHGDEIQNGQVYVVIWHNAGLLNLESKTKRYYTISRFTTLDGSKIEPNGFSREIVEKLPRFKAGDKVYVVSHLDDWKDLQILEMEVLEVGQHYHLNSIDYGFYKSYSPRTVFGSIEELLEKFDVEACV